MSRLVGYELLPFEFAEAAQQLPEEVTIARALEDVRDAGFNAFEFLANTTYTWEYARRVMKFAEWPGPPRIVSDGEWFARIANAIRQGKALGLQLTTIFCDGEYINPETADRERDQAFIVSRILAASGAKHLLVTGGPRRPEPQHSSDLKRLASTLNAIGSDCASVGVTLCLHSHIDTGVETPEDIQELLDGTDPASVALAFDTAHVAAGGGDPVDLLRKHASRVAYVHLKDVAIPTNRGGFTGQARYRAFKDLGEGTLDFVAIGGALEECGYTGPIIAELDRSTDPADSARRAREFVRRTLNI